MWTLKCLQIEIKEQQKSLYSLSIQIRYKNVSVKYPWKINQSPKYICKKFKKCVRMK